MRRAKKLKFSANHPLNPELDHHIEHFDLNGNITDDMHIVYTTLGNSLGDWCRVTYHSSCSASASIRSQHSLGSYLIVVVAATLSDVTLSHFDLQDLWQSYLETLGVGVDSVILTSDCSEYCFFLATSETFLPGTTRLFLTLNPRNFWLSSRSFEVDIYG